MHTFQKTALRSLVAIGMGVVIVPAAALEFSQVTAIEIDDILITSPGFDLGGSGFEAGVPTSPARVEWQQGWFGSIVNFHGTIHFNGVADSCARVQLISYDADSEEMSRAYSTVECAPNDGHVERSVSVQGQVGAAEVKVRLQSLLDNGDWVAVGGSGSQVVTYGPTLGTSEVSISRPEFDLGSGDFVGGTAAAPATVTWSLKPGTTLSMPVMTGKLYMKKADDLCGRMRYQYSDINKFVIETRYGPEHCVTNDDLHTFALNANDYSGNSAVDELKITIERSPAFNGVSTGNWTAVGSTTASLPRVSVTSNSDPLTLP